MISHLFLHQGRESFFILALTSSTGKCDAARVILATFLFSSSAHNSCENSTTASNLVSEVTEAFLTHYNDERPTQARSCGNQPPRMACPDFPVLPPVPLTVNPDRWLVAMDKQAIARTIRMDGKLTINREDYYVSRSLAGQRVTCWVNAAEKCFDIWQPEGRIKSIPIKS